MTVKRVPDLGWTKKSVAASILLVTQQQKDEMAARIRALMASQGLNNPQLARKAEVAEKTVSRLLNARTDDPRYDTLDRVARALGVTQGDLRGPAPSPLGLGADGDGDGWSALDRRLNALQDAINALAIDTAERDLEVIRRLDAMQPPPEEFRRRRPR